MNTTSFTLADEWLIDEERGMIPRRRFYSRDDTEAATLILKPGQHLNMSKIVLEGAPGQGKSTITQYICQVNRIKLLDEAPELEQLPEKHRVAPVRIPFRVDLRDYASWLAGKNPFVSEGQSAPITSHSLESFVSAQVTYLSGGQQFSPNDLLSVSKSGQVLFVLDGFDEVADLMIRDRVIDEVSKSAARIHAHERSAQFIVTSRPSAFTNSPGFNKDDWFHLELQSMTSGQIDIYSKKWMTARHLQSKERAEFSVLLKEKLEQTHTRDLARNPMQLTILLALIQTRGLSLPDKRTSLYDNYMELFFNRESEKSRVVREHRDLLIDIHRYLAWLLHSQAELKNSGGLISEGELKSVLRQYLDSEGHSTTLVDLLFTGMVERVVALVSRVQGTFEFEVQPLREYFAARHLYETAPYSPPGNEKPGTKPERFDALARNFFWLNVLRFYCGCFSRGELASLVDGLSILSQDSSYGLTTHPRTISLMLLGDWVFSQQPLSVKRVVDQVSQQPGLKLFLSDDIRQSSNLGILADRCGRIEVIDRALATVDQVATNEDRFALLRLVRQNMSPAECVSLWLSEEGRSPSLARWISDGRRLGVFRTLQGEDAFRILGIDTDLAVFEFCLARRFDLIVTNPEYYEHAVQLLLRAKLTPLATIPQHEPSSNLEKLGCFFFSSFWQALRNSDRDAPMRFFVFRRFGIRQANDEKMEDIEISETARKVADLASLIEDRFEASAASWSGSLEHWEDIATKLIEQFGPTWLVKRLSVIAAGVKSQAEPGVWDDNAWDGRAGICRAVRFARLKSGNANWWKTQLQLLDTPDRRKFGGLVVSTWATFKTLTLLSEDLSDLLDSLEYRDWVDVYTSLRQGLNETNSVGTLKVVDLSVFERARSDRFLLLMANRCSEAALQSIVDVLVSKHDGSDQLVLKFVSDYYVGMASKGKVDWDKILSLVKINYDRGASPQHFDTEGVEIPIHVAHEICRNAPLYPQSLVRLATTRQAISLGASAAKLGTVAHDQSWFAY